MFACSAQSHFLASVVGYKWLSTTAIEGFFQHLPHGRMILNLDFVQVLKITSYNKEEKDTHETHSDFICIVEKE